MARNKHPEQTVQLILDTASTLFLQKGYDKTTLQDIIDATKLSKGAIYNHFVQHRCSGGGPGQKGAYRGGEAAGDVPHRRAPVLPGRHFEHAALPH